MTHDPRTTAAAVSPHPMARGSLSRPPSARLSSTAIHAGRLPSARPTRTDRLTARAIKEIAATDGTCEIASYHGLELLGLTVELLGFSGSPD